MRLRTSYKRLPAAIGLLLLVLAIGIGIHRLAHRDHFDIALGLAGGNEIRKTEVLSRLPAAFMSGVYPADVPLLSIDIDFQHLIRIRADRDAALDVGVLLNPTEVPARIEHAGETYRARIRLKGDLYPHWSDANRWSFRVEVKGGETLDGFAAFSLQQAGNRQFPHDQLFQFWLRQVGLATPRFSVYRVSVNGADWGVMLAEEHMTHQFLERNRRKEAPIVKFGNELRWYYDAANRHLPDRPGVRYGQADVGLYQESRYRADNRMRALFAQAVLIHDKVVHRDADIVASLNRERFAKALAAALAWDNTHTLHYPNSRFYLDPYMLQLEPITTDQAPPKRRAALGKSAGGIPGLYRLFAGDARFGSAFHQAMEELKATLPALREEHDRLCAPFPLDCPDFDYSFVSGNLEAMMSEGDALIASVLGETPPPPRPTGPPIVETPLPPDPALRYPRHVHIRYREDGRLTLYNVLQHEVTVESVTLTCKEDATCTPRDLLPAPLRIPPGRAGGLPMSSAVSLEPVALTGDDYLEVRTRVGTQEKLERTSIAECEPGRDPHRAAGIWLPHFVQRDGDGYRIGPGIWHVRRPLILPAGAPLTIAPGTELEFAPDAFLMLHAPLIAEGTEEQPIVLRPSGDSWKGFGVFGADGPSSLRHVEISGAEALESGPLRLTGAANFHRSDVSIRNTLFAGTRAEDALNIIEAEFLVEESTFEDTVSDAFDSDYATGTLNGVQFIEIGGDGFDASGSTISAKGLSFVGVRDKALSVGENSRITVADMRADDIGTAVASKDGAIATIDRLSVGDTHLHAGMAYRKKSIYDGGELRIRHLDGTAAVVAQHGSRAWLNGAEVPTIPLDVDWLYEQGPMRKTR